MDLKHADLKHPDLKPDEHEVMITDVELISDELCDFLHLEHGSSVTNHDVTTKIITYIKQHELLHGFNIEPDLDLEKLVGNAEERLQTMEKTKLRRITKGRDINVTDKLTLFNLHEHLNKHFLNRKPGGMINLSNPVNASALDDIFRPM